MIRVLVPFLALSGAAQAEMPSPLFCSTVAHCTLAVGMETCTPVEAATPFVLRETEGEWLIQTGPRGAETWVFMAATGQDALTDAPEGTVHVVFDAGTASDGARMLHQYGIGARGLTPTFSRHACWTTQGAAAQ